MSPGSTFPSPSSVIGRSVVDEIPARCLPVPRIASSPWWSPIAKHARLDSTFATLRGMLSAAGTGVANTSVTPYSRAFATIFSTSSAASSPTSETNNSWHSSITTMRGRIRGSACARRRVSFGSLAATAAGPVALTCSPRSRGWSPAV